MFFTRMRGVGAAVLAAGGGRRGGRWESGRRKGMGWFGGES